MKNLLLIPLLFYTISSIAKPFATPKKVALLIGISNYSTKGGWQDTHAQQDLQLIQKSLLQQGFLQENIFLLENEQATKAGILAAFETHLIQKVSKNDVAVFHFAGHGQQVKDDNGDELDGLDEALVPFDSPLHFEENKNEGQFLIRDDELEKMLLQLRKKLGKKGHVLTLLDACHSGTGTRGNNQARGTNIILADSLFLENKMVAEKDISTFSATAERAKKIAPMVAFFGSAANQLNYETSDADGNLVGSFSYAFSKSLAQADHTTSYRVLFEKIALLMSASVPMQTPFAEGNLDQTVLNGELLGAVFYQKILPKGYVDDRTLLMDGGVLTHWHEGTKVALYPPDTRDTNAVQAIAIGEIVKEGLLQSTVQLQSPISPEAALQSWVFCRQKSYGDLSVSVRMDLENSDIRQTIEMELANHSAIVLKDVAADLQVVFVKEKEEIQLITGDGQILKKIKKTKTPRFIAYRLAESILGYLQANFLRTLEVANPKMDLELELLQEDRAIENQLKIGEKFKIQVTNKGTVPVFYTLLGIEAANELSILIPSNQLNHAPEEFFLAPEQSHLYEQEFVVTPPCGIEVLKLIATREPLNLNGIIASRGNTSATAHPFETLFGATFLYTNRSGGGRFKALPKVHVESKVFVIVE